MHSSVSGIHGNLLEVTVVGCNKLKDTEWISRQDPYVCLEYGSSKSRTRTCTDGGKNPTFQEKFNFTLIEGLREINVMVWNSNTLKDDDFIGSGKIQLQKALSQGFDDSTWPIQSGRGRHTGEVRVIIHYPNFRKHGTAGAPSASPYMHAPHSTGYGAPPVQTAHYPSAPYSSAPSYPSYPPNPSAYPPSSYYPAPPAAYPPQQNAYPPQQNAYPPQPNVYPPQGYPPQQPYPPQAYPPQQPYPPAPYPYPQPPRY